MIEFPLGRIEDYRMEHEHSAAGADQGIRRCLDLLPAVGDIDVVATLDGLADHGRIDRRLRLNRGAPASKPKAHTKPERHRLHSVHRRSALDQGRGIAVKTACRLPLSATRSQVVGG